MSALVVGRDFAVLAAVRAQLFDERVYFATDDASAIAVFERRCPELAFIEVARRLREQKFHARTLQLKLRYKDFTTITRAHSVETPTQLDNEIFSEIRKLFHANWRKGAEIRLLGVQASSFSGEGAQGDLLLGQGRGKWQQALTAMDRVREKFGESSVRLGTGMKGGFRERTHENPAALPGKSKPPNQ